MIKHSGDTIMPLAGTILNFIRNGRSSKVICEKTENAPSTKIDKMRLFKSKLRKRVEAKIDELRDKLTCLEYKREILRISEPKIVKEIQEDLIDQIRLLKSILS